MKSLATLLLPGDRKYLLSNACSIGRERTSDLVFDDPHLSRNHARLEVRNGHEFWLEDLGSSNGTKVNGKRIARPRRLRNGDRIQIGHTKIIFRTVKQSRAKPRPDDSETESTSASPESLQLKGVVVIDSPDTVAEACFSIPAVRAIGRAHPKSTLVVVANADLGPLWRQVSQINRVIEVADRASASSISKLLRKTGIRFQSSLAWEVSPAARAFAKIGIKQRLGEAGGELKKHLTHPIDLEQKPGPIQHRVEHYLLLARKIGADPYQPENFAHAKRPPQSTPPRIAIAPGSDFGSAAEWMPDRFHQLAKTLQAEGELVVLPSPGRPEPAAELADSLNLRLIKRTGIELLDFLATCRMLVANDGSLPHLASLVGTPSLVLFGPNEPEWRRPLGRIHEVIHHRVPCSGCLLPKCPLDHRCLTEIELDEVKQHLQELLAEE